MLQSVLRDFPHTDISVSIVWIDMLATDNAAAASAAAGIIVDSRVRHFHDPRASRLAGAAFAKNLIQPGGGPAWDIYMFFEKGVVWGDDPPRPAQYMHQLGGGRRADPRHYHAGPNLIEKLHEAMHALTGDSCVPP